MLGGQLPTNPVFELDNRSKRSIAVDLSTEQGRQVALALIDGADVFLTNIRIAALERVGLGESALRARNPRLVYAIVTGYGLDGPDADKPAYDIAAYWARSGLAAALTPPGAQLPFQAANAESVRSRFRPRGFNRSSRAVLPSWTHASPARSAPRAGSHR